MNFRPAIGFIILISTSFSLTACSRPLAYQIPPPDKSLSIHDKLDRIVAIRRDKGSASDFPLNPGLTRNQIAELTKGLRFKFPEELVQLYLWRNGSPADSQSAALFRDQRFLPLAEAVDHYRQMLTYYPFDVWSLDRIGKVDLRDCFPFAGLDGSAWAVNSGGEFSGYHPVISVFEGVELFFWSFDHMLDTVLDWCAQGDHSADGVTLTREQELRIWKAHNKGIFVQSGA